MSETTESTSFEVARATALLALAALAFLGALVAQSSARAEHAELDFAEASLLPDRATLGALSLGYENFVADLIWMTAIQRHDKRNERELLIQYTDAMIYLDPDFKRVYAWSGNALVFAGGRTSPENVDAANRILALGAERYPDDFYYPYTIGLNYAFYYPSRDATHKDQLQRKAIEYLQIAMQKPGVPRGTALLIAGLIRASDDSTAVIDFLEQAYVAETDPEVRRKIEERMMAIGGDRLRLFNRQAEARQAWLESNGFDYLPPALAFNLGHRIERLGLERR